STKESLSVLARFDTDQSYGSAAEDIEGNLLWFECQLFQSISIPKSSHVNVRPPFFPPSPSSFASDLLLKVGWETDLNSTEEKKSVKVKCRII
ncbi:fat-like cadherin-related tumor suppressor, partial [Nephila pilipes]